MRQIRKSDRSKAQFTDQITAVRPALLIGFVSLPKIKLMKPRCNCLFNREGDKGRTRRPAFHFCEKASIPRCESSAGSQIEVYRYNSFLFKDCKGTHSSLAEDRRL